MISWQPQPCGKNDSWLAWIGRTGDGRRSVHRRLVRWTCRAFGAKPRNSARHWHVPTFASLISASVNQFIDYRLLSVNTRPMLLLSVFWHCWLVVRKSIRPVKIEWWGVGVVICLERGTDCLHMVKLMSPPSKNPIISCPFKSRLALPFSYRLTHGCSGKVKRVSSSSSSSSRPSVCASEPVCLCFVFLCSFYYFSNCSLWSMWSDSNKWLIDWLTGMCQANNVHERADCVSRARLWVVLLVVSATRLSHTLGTRPWDDSSGTDHRVLLTYLSRPAAESRPVDYTIKYIRHEGSTSAEIQYTEHTV